MTHRIAILLLFLLVPTLLVAQPQQPTGTITGKVVDSAGVPLVRATIRVVGTQRGAWARSDGTFVIAKVGSGTYKLEVRYPGMEPLDLTVTVEDSLTTTIAAPIVLRPRSTDYTRDPRPKPRPDNVGTVRSISAEELERMGRQPE